VNLELVEKIANAVLYEGYILYPYRPSATKNQQRWNFGGVYPRKFSEAQNGTDAWLMKTECLVAGDENTTVDIRVRFLQMVKREVGEPIADCGLRILRTRKFLNLIFKPLNYSKSAVKFFKLGRKRLSVKSNCRVFP
jgi:hypothetical protein